MGFPEPKLLLNKYALKEVKNWVNFTEKDPQFFGFPDPKLLPKKYVPREVKNWVIGALLQTFARAKRIVVSQVKFLKNYYEPMGKV